MNPTPSKDEEDLEKQPSPWALGLGRRYSAQPYFPRKRHGWNDQQKPWLSRQESEFTGLEAVKISQHIVPVSGPSNSADPLQGVLVRRDPLAKESLVFSNVQPQDFFSLRTQLKLPMLGQNYSFEFVNGVVGGDDFDLAQFRKCRSDPSPNKEFGNDTP